MIGIDGSFMGFPYIGIPQNSQNGWFIRENTING